MKRNCLRALPLVAGVFLMAVAAPAAASVKPNILFVLCDDLGFGDIGVFFQNSRREANDRSEPFHATPRIDAMAAEGIQLRRHYCPAPVCAPSRASLLLGVHQGHANVRDNQFDKALEGNHTLGTVLKQAGYATAAIGKWGLQGEGRNGGPATWPAFPTRRGFDDYFGYIRHADGHEHYPKEGLYRGTKEVYDGEQVITADLDGCYTADLFTARAKTWIQQHRETKPDQPFFLYLAYDTPHAVTEIPAQAYPAGGGVKGGLRWLGTPGQMINTAADTVDSYYHPDYASATWDDDHDPATAEVDWPDVYKRYATSVRRLDDCLADLLQLLKDLELDSSTLVVFTTDNGTSRESYLEQDFDPDFFNSFGPFDGIKRDTWEGGVRVGAVVRWPGSVPAGAISDLACSFWDWMPTFAELAGVTTPARSDGVSLLPTLTGQGTQREPLVYIEYFQNGRTPGYREFAPQHRDRIRKQMQVIHIGAYKGVRYNTTSADDDFEIYDVVTDPQEVNDLAADPALAAVQRQMKARVLQVRRPNDSAPRPYDKSYVPALEAEAPPEPAVRYAVYRGQWPWVPEFSTMTAGAAGALDQVRLPPDLPEGAIGLAFQGLITAPEDGEYTFRLRTDSGAHFRVHDATVIDDDFGRTGEPVSASIRLAAGQHPFRLYTVHGPQARILEFTGSGPGSAERETPDPNRRLPERPETHILSTGNGGAK